MTRALSYIHILHALLHVVLLPPRHFHNIVDSMEQKRFYLKLLRIAIARKSQQTEVKQPFFHVFVCGLCIEQDSFEAAKNALNFTFISIPKTSQVESEFYRD